VSLWRNWGEIRAGGIAIRLEYLALLLPLPILSGLAHAAGWHFTLAALGQRIRFRKSFSIYTLSQASRYIPGGLWNFAGFLYLGGREGISKTVSAAAAAIFTAAGFLSAAAVFIAALPLLTGAGSVASFWPIFAALFILGAACLLRPDVFLRLFNVALRILKRQPLPVRIGRREVALMALLEILNWLLAGATHCFIFAAMGVATPGAAAITGAVAAAWAAGFAVLFVPNGLGVREGALALILSAYGISPAAAVGASIAVRLLALVAEAALAVVGAFFLRRTARVSPQRAQEKLI
jgi:uncharacterized membrane protein YbhN (UPF0104 family)